jgi:hypothetical protein
MSVSKTMTEFAQYSVQRYAELELDGQPCFHGASRLIS